MPLRVGSSIFLGGLHGGTKVAVEMARGSLITLPGLAVFLLALEPAIQRWELGGGFAAAALAWFAITIPMFFLFGKA